MTMFFHVVPGNAVPVLADTPLTKLFQVLSSSRFPSLLRVSRCSSGEKTGTKAGRNHPKAGDAVAAEPPTGPVLGRRHILGFPIQSTCA